MPQLLVTPQFGLTLCYFLYSECKLGESSTLRMFYTWFTNSLYRLQLTNKKKKKRVLLYLQYSQATYQYYMVITKLIQDAMEKKATYHF